MIYNPLVNYDLFQEDSIAKIIQIHCKKTSQSKPKLFLYRWIMKRNQFI